MADPSLEEAPSPRAEPVETKPTYGLDRMMEDIDFKPATNGVANGEEKPTLQPGVVSAAVMTAVSAASVSQVAPSQKAPATSQRDAAVPTPALSKPYEPETRGSLMVSAAETNGASPVAPVVTLSSSKSPPLRRKAGPKKMGAKKLGAMKLGSGGGAVKLSGFDDTVPAKATTLSVGTGEAAAGADVVDSDLELARKLQLEEDAAAAAPSSRLAAAATAALASQPPAPSSSKISGSGTTGGSIYRSVNDSTSSGGGTYGSYRNGGSSSYAASSLSTYSSASGSFDKEKYKNVKGIGSDMLFGARDDDPEEQARRIMKGQEFSNSSAISSDMYFDRDVDNNTGSGGGIGDMADQIATDLQGVGQAATKLKVCDAKGCPWLWRVVGAVSPFGAGFGSV